MSVVLEDRLRELGRSAPSLLAGRPTGYGLAALTAAQVRAEAQRIERTPKPEEEAHGDVWGDKPTSRRRRFATLAQWVVEP